MSERGKLIGAGRIVAVVFGLGGLCGLAGPAYAQSLQDTIALALDQSDRLSAERAAVSALGEGIVQAKAAQRPRIAANATLQQRQLTRTSPFDTITGPSQRTSDLDLDGVEAGLEVSQVLFQGFQNRNQVSAARAERAAGEAAMDQVYQQVVLDAVRAHADVMLAARILELRRESVATLDQQLSGIVRRRELRDATVTDLAQAEARGAAVRAELVAAQADVRALRSRYEGLTGQAPATLGPLVDPDGVPKSLSEAVEGALASSPRIASAQARIDAAQATVSVARGAYAPSVALFARFGIGEDETFPGDSREDLTVGVRASIPLFEGGGRSSRVREASDTAQRQAFLLAEEQRVVRNAVVDAFEALGTAEGQLSTLEVRLEASGRAFAAIEKEYAAGARTVSDVLDAERERLDAQIAREQVVHQAYLARWTLLALMGRAGEMTSGIDPS